MPPQGQIAWCRPAALGPACSQIRRRSGNALGPCCHLYCQALGHSAPTRTQPNARQQHGHGAIARLGRPPSPEPRHRAPPPSQAMSAARQQVAVLFCCHLDSSTESPHPLNRVWVGAQCAGVNGRPSFSVKPAPQQRAGQIEENSKLLPQLVATLMLAQEPVDALHAAAEIRSWEEGTAPAKGLQDEGAPRETVAKWHANALDWQRSATETVSSLMQS